MGFKITGFEKVQKQLSELSRKAEAINGEHSVGISEILTVDFLARCSRFTSAADMFAQSGFKVDSQDDFSAIPDDEWDTFVNENTTYSSWHEMKTEGAKDWVKKRMGF